MIYFFNWISFLPLLGMLLLSQLSLLLVSCLTDFQGTGCTYQRKNHLLGVFQLLSLDLVHLGILPLNTEYLKWSSIYPHWYVQQDVPSRYQISRLGSRLTSTLTKIFPFLPLLFSLPKERRSKKNLPGCSVFPLNADRPEAFFCSSLKLQTC